ncbi:MAG TPA: ribosome silencing factor [Steroidobacteraceae bacterium]|nr:ribosome silencing factor [Steroidobacteraceae bacterium]
MVAALDEMKAVNIRVLDVRGMTDVADAMVVASGTSDRHVRAIAQHVVDRARDERRRPMGVEGSRDGEWVLVDLQDVIVHVMLPRVREFYAIEQLWEQSAASGAGQGGAAAGRRPPDADGADGADGVHGVDGRRARRAAPTRPRQRPRRVRAGGP